MLAMEELEDPASARERFARLTVNGGRESRIAADALAALGFAPIDGEPGRRRVAELRVPDEAEFFADHFPRKPVFPGTLLLESKIRLGAELAAEALGVPASEARIRFVRAVKLRRFLSPGTVVTLISEIDRLEPAGARVRLRAEAEGRLVSTASATAELAR